MAGTYAFGAVWIEYVATKPVSRNGSLAIDMKNPGYVEGTVERWVGFVKCSAGELEGEVRLGCDARIKEMTTKPAS